MGVLACAAALARTGHAVLVVEQHGVAGGLTQTFSRGGFRWDVGVHYLGDMGPDGEARVLLNWLTGGAIQFNSLGAVYDTIHFPGNFVAEFARPEAALKLELKERFSAASNDIDAFFVALADAVNAGRALFALVGTVERRGDDPAGRRPQAACGAAGAKGQLSRRRRE
jgi:all-trans-retinol 13,14-reductase